MATTYEAIATVTVGSGGAANIEFTNIPQTYTDLYIVLSARSNTNSTSGDKWRDMYININNTGNNTNVTARNVIGLGSSAVSNTVVAIGTVSNDGTASTFSSASIYIPNYTSSNNKSISIDQVTENNTTASLAGLSAFLWSNSAAITSIKFVLQSTDTFVQYSTATLYGIKNS